MFSKANAASIFDSLLTSAKSARDTFYLVTGTGPLAVHIQHSHESMNEQTNIQETLKEFAEDLKAEAAANNRIFLTEEFADVQSIVKDTNEIFKELKKLMQECHTLISNEFAGCKSPSEVSEKIESKMDELNRLTGEYKKKCRTL